MFSWIFKQSIKREIKKEIDNIHHILHNSFGNIKQDIINLNKKHTNLHNLHKEKEQKLQEYEERLTRLENYLLNKIEEHKPKTIIDNKFENSIFESLTFTHEKIFRGLYGLQKRMDYNPISIKSLAKIIYPDKDYSAVVSTLSEYLTFLATFGLILKKRKGKEIVAELTDLGYEYVKKLKEEEKLKEEKLKIKSKS